MLYGGIGTRRNHTFQISSYSNRENRGKNNTRTKRERKTPKRERDKDENKIKNSSKSKSNTNITNQYTNTKRRYSKDEVLQ